MFAEKQEVAALECRNLGAVYRARKCAKRLGVRRLDAALLFVLGIIASAVELGTLSCSSGLFQGGVEPPQSKVPSAQRFQRSLGIGAKRR